MGQFDPYHKWLGIRPKDQAPNHYRLLGIDLFEDDPDVIDAAAEQRMTLLKQCATGPHTEDSQKLLNEVAAARLCLLKPAERALYDAELKSKLAAAVLTTTGDPPPQPEVLAVIPDLGGSSPAPFDFAPDQEAAPRRPPQRNRSPRKAAPFLTPAFGIAGLLLCVAVGVYIYGTTVPTPEPVDGDNKVAVITEPGRNDKKPPDPAPSPRSDSLPEPDVLPESDAHETPIRPVTPVPSHTVSEPQPTPAGETAKASEKSELRVRIDPTPKLRSAGSSSSDEASGDKKGDEDATAKDMKAIQGVWTAIEIEEDGQVFDKETVKSRSVHMSLKGNSIVYTSNKNGRPIELRGLFQIDADMGTWDCMARASSGIGEFRGIYSLSGDRLTICNIVVSSGITTRPSQFKTEANSRGILTIFQRETK